MLGSYDDTGLHWYAVLTVYALTVQWGIKVDILYSSWIFYLGNCASLGTIPRFVIFIDPRLVYLPFFREWILAMKLAQRSTWFIAR